MDASELPTDVELLKALLVSTLAAKERELKQARFEATQFKHEVNELSSTVAEQEKKAIRSGTNDSGIAGCLTRQDSGAN